MTRFALAVLLGTLAACRAPAPSRAKIFVPAEDARRGAVMSDQDIARERVFEQERATLPFIALPAEDVPPGIQTME